MAYVTDEWRARGEWGLSFEAWPWYEIQDCGLRQWGRFWCPSWPNTVWHSPRYLPVWVFIYVSRLPEGEMKYCNHHLLSYESCSSPKGETVPRLPFPSVLLWAFRTRLSCWLISDWMKVFLSFFFFLQKLWCFASLYVNSPFIHLIY